MGSNIEVLCPRPGCLVLPIAPLLSAVNPLLTLTVPCKSCNFLRSGFFFFKYYLVLRSLCSADFNKKCACSPSPMFKSWTTLTISKTFPASLLQIKIKKNVELESFHGWLKYPNIICFYRIIFLSKLISLLWKKFVGVW